MSIKDIEKNENVLVVTANYVAGHKIVENYGYTYGLTVRSRGLGGQLLGGLRTLGGGEIKEYVKMMEEAREEALRRLIENAESLGANAIISTRFDSGAISEIMQEILAYGTAVKIVKSDDTEIEPAVDEID